MVEEEIIFQAIPYLQYFLIVGAVIAGIVGAVKWIHRKGIVHGVDTLRGETIQKDIEAIQKELKKEKEDTDFSHRLLYKKIDENRCTINKIGKDVAKIKGAVEALSNFIMHGKKLKFNNNSS